MSDAAPHKVRVLLFGPEAAAAGRACAEVAADGRVTCAHLRARLGEDLPALRRLLTTGRFAVNSEFAPDDRVIEPGDEVALIGMVSGG